MRRAAPFVAAVVATLWFFRQTLAAGTLPGDQGDARWTVALAEHWYSVWRGEAAVREVGFFQPVDATLGMSDPFLLQGQLHSLARVVGVGPVGSWLLAHAVMYLVGALGVAALSRRVLDGTVSQVLLVLAAGLSYPLVVQMAHVQVFGFLWTSWLLLAVLELHRPIGPRRRRLAFATLALVPPLLAVSSWYALALGGLVLAALGAAGALVAGPGAARRAVGEAVSAAWAIVRTPPGLAAAALGVVGWAAAAWIYVPARGVLPATTWSEVARYSPRPSDVINASMAGGGLWAGWYRSAFDLRDQTGEEALGFTPILAVALVAAGVVALALRVRRPSGDRSSRAAGAALAAWLTVAAVVVLFVQVGGNSLFRIPFELVPGFDSLRSPFRVQILLYPLAVFAVLKAVEAVAAARGPAGAAGRQRWALALVPPVVLGAVLVEMHRTPHSRWRPDELLPAHLDPLVDDVAGSCGSLVVVEEPGPQPLWEGSVDASVLSALTGIPTPQGYSRGWPVGHPGPAVPPEPLLGWLRDGGFDGDVCLISTGGVDRVAVG